MLFRQIFDERLAQYSYLVGCQRTGAAIVIDPERDVDRYAELVGRHQRRASRIAFHYMRDAAEADEAVQDAFMKAYSHLDSFREELPFEVWFTRILINGCLDRIKARTRRERWIAPMPAGPGGERDFADVKKRGEQPSQSIPHG